MDKNNCNFKILYKRSIPVPYGSICCTYHPLKYSSPNGSSKHSKRQEPHKRAYLSGNGGLGKKISREWAKSKKKDKAERATGLGR